MSKHDEFPTKPDYEAKYKALEQAVKDALEDIDYQKELSEGIGLNKRDNDYHNIAEGLNRASVILTEKTGITA